MAKRVNKRFLVILTTVVLVGGVVAMGTAFVLPRIFKKNPQELVREADRLEKEATGEAGKLDAAKLDDAILNYQKAVGADPKNLELRIGLGDLYNRHVTVDPQNMMKARAAWESALGIDPGYMPALQRQLDFMWEYMTQLSARPEVFTAVREAANRMLAADPDNATAKARLHIVTVRQLLANVPTPRANVEQSVAALRELAKRDPANADLPFWAANAESFYVAQDAKDVSNRVEAREAFERLEAAVDAMTSGQENNAAMQYRHAQLLTSLASLDELTAAPAGPVRAGATTAPTTRRAKDAPAGRFSARVTAALDAARAHAKPEDATYVETHLFAAEWLRALGKPDESRKLMEALVEAKGDDPQVRLAYARIARPDPTVREKLVALLERPVSMAGLVGVDAMRRKDQEAGLQFELATIRVVDAATQTDPAKRRALVDRVLSDLKPLEQQVGPQSPPLLEVKGRIALLEGKVAEAIGLLDKAVELRGEANPNLESMEILAAAYSQQNQTGQAERLLRRIATRRPDRSDMRIKWIESLVRDGRGNEAREQVARFRREFPDAKEGAALEARVEGGAKLDAYVEKMPEDTPAARAQKARLLRADGKVDEAVALAQSAFKDEPTNLAAIETLLEIFMSTNRRAEAQALTEAAIKANPDNAQLKRLPDRLVQRTPEEFEKWRLEQINQEPDESVRALRMQELHLQKSIVAAQRNDPELAKREAAEAERHLAAAEKLKPGDLGVTGRRFEFLLQQRRFDEAATVLAPLAAANADSADGNLLRFRLAMAKNDLPAADTAAREMTRLRPQFSYGWEYLGVVRQAQGRHREAVAAYANALERQGQSYNALKGLIECHTALGDPGEAQAVIARARTAFPQDANMRELALKHEMEHGDPMKVVAEREQLWKANPNVPGNAVQLADAYLRSLGLVKDPAILKKTIDKARNVLEAGMKQWPADARFQVPLSQVMAAQGDFIGGEKLLKDYAARPEVTDKAAVDLLLAEYYERAGKPATAEQSYRDALAKTGNAPGVRQKLADLLARTGRLDDAVAQLDGVAGPDAARQRAQYLLAANKTAEAEQALRVAIEASPSSADLSNLLIDVLVGARRLDEADRLARDRVAKSADDAAARYYVALVKMRRQPPDAAGAVADLSKLAEDNPRGVHVFTLLADARYAAGDTDAALDDLNRALGLNPQNRDTRAKLIDWFAAVGRWADVTRVAAEAERNPRTANDPTWARATARAAAATGKFADAEKHILRSIAMVPADRAGELEAEYLGILNQAKGYAKVIKVSDGWIAKGRKDWWIYQSRGVARAGSKDTAGALKEFDLALAGLKPDEQFASARTVIQAIAGSAGPDEALRRIEKWEETDPRWRLAAAELCLGKQDATAAVAHLQPLEAEADKLPADVRASLYRTLGQSYHSMQPRPDLSKAVDAYTKYLALQPADVLALNNLAYLLAEEVSPPRIGDAKAYSQKAYDIVREWKPGEGKTRILDTHGWILVLGGGKDVEEGVRVLQEGVEESPILEAHYHLGEAHLRQKRGADAEEQLNAALAMIEKSKAEKKPYDETLETRIQSALDKAKALNAAGEAAGAR